MISLSKKKIYLMTIIFIITGCSMQDETKALNYKGYLILENKYETIKYFSLGEYSSLGNCIKSIEYEYKIHKRKQNGNFFTNNDYTYGGFRTESIRIENKIVGIKCRATNYILITE